MKRILLLLTLAVLSLDSLRAQTADTTVVVPASGYLPVKPSHPFSGPASLLIVNTNASNNAKTTDIRYYTWRADTVVAMASCYILVGQPGTYTLTFHDAANISGSSNSGWAPDAGIYTDSRNGRMVYKFVCTDERTGFERDADCTADNYKSCHFGEGEHFFVSITQPIADKIAPASGKTDHADLDFIVWHGPTPADAQAADVTTVSSPLPAANQLFDLQGRRVNQPAKGLYIRGGKIVSIQSTH